MLNIYDEKILFSLLGISMESAAFKQLLSDYQLTIPSKSAREGGSFYIEKKDLGFALKIVDHDFFDEVYQKPAIAGQHYLISLFLASSEQGDKYNTFAEPLPKQLAWGMTVDELDRVLGAHDEPNEFDSNDKQLTLYWRKIDGLDYVGWFNKPNLQLVALSVGFANMYV
jgi:hypothetical protein